MLPREIKAAKQHRNSLARATVLEAALRAIGTLQLEQLGELEEGTPAMRAVLIEAVQLAVEVLNDGA